ncbi:hypothetical protein WUBG_16410 [Wuchereria bancrofti]|uniref:Uncharacterized protein n=1 Tax=Wuchereria bancrofti TaxID=6293 RepID=J9E6S6_WUCBA|nr:hypothetical protein WUBG_16410 [Wuchereria bancrofti]
MHRYHLQPKLPFQDTAIAYHPYERLKIEIDGNTLCHKFPPRISPEACLYVLMKLRSVLAVAWDTLRQADLNRKDNSKPGKAQVNKTTITTAIATTNLLLPSESSSSEFFTFSQRRSQVICGL